MGPPFQAIEAAADIGVGHMEGEVDQGRKVSFLLHLRVGVAGIREESPSVPDPWKKRWAPRLQTKEDKAPTLFQAEVWVQLSALVAIFYICTVQRHPTMWLFTHTL